MLFQSHFFPLPPLSHFLVLLQFHKFFLILLSKEEGIASEWFLTESSKGSLKKPFFFFSSRVGNKS